MGSLPSLIGDDAELVRERDFQLLFLANLVAPLGMAVVSPIIEVLTVPFGVPPTEIGLIVSAFTAPAVVMIPIAGIIADRIGRKPVLVAGLLLFGAGIGIAFTTDFLVVLGLRLLQGVGFACITPIIITSIGDLYTGSKEATAQGLRFSGTGIVLSAGPLISGAIVVIAWQIPFLLYALAFPVAVVLYLWFEEPADSTVSAVSSGDGGGTASQLRFLYRLFSRRRVSTIVIARGLPMIVWFAFLTYNSIIVIQLLGGSPGQAGLFAAIASLTFAVSATQAGRITAFFDDRTYPLFGANVGLGVGFVILTFASNLWLVAVGVALMGGSFGVVLALYRSIITGVAPPHLRGGLVSLAESFGRLMSTLTPIGMGIAIAAATPSLGFQSAVRVTSIGVVLIGAGGGLLCLLVLAALPSRFDAQVDVGGPAD